MARDLEPTQTLLPGPSDDPALDAALAAAFGPDSVSRGWSQPPLLRDDPSDHGPLVQPSSPEALRATSDRWDALQMCLADRRPASEPGLGRRPAE